MPLRRPRATRHAASELDGAEAMTIRHGMLRRYLRHAAAYDYLIAPPSQRACVCHYAAALTMPAVTLRCRLIQYNNSALMPAMLIAAAIHY